MMIFTNIEILGQPVQLLLRPYLQNRSFIWSKHITYKIVHILITKKIDIKERPYLPRYKGYEADIGVKRNILESSTTLSTVAKIIEATKMP